MAKLILHNGTDSQEFAIEGEVTIGRASGNVVQINEPKASRNHARVLADNGEILVEDLGSSNGTRVNGRKIDVRQPLFHGDTIQIGQTRLQFDEPAKRKPDGVPEPSKKSVRRKRREDTSDPFCGKTLGGYKIVSKLGQGGMGAVYRAQQLSMDREVALKVMSGELSKNRDFVKGFLQEARIAGQLTHSCLVQVHDVGETDGTLYYSMELIEGETVHAILKREGKLPVPRSLEIAASVCEALAHAQRHKIVHQDVKPHNIMVDDRGNVKLADLGLAVMAGREKPADKRPNVLMGSPHYMSPEQSKKGKIDTRTDIYALGVTMFQMLTGRVPFDGPNSLVILTKHMTQDRPDPRGYDVTIPHQVAELVRNMMAIEPEKRPGDPKALAEELKQLKEEFLLELELGKRKGHGVFKKRAVLSGVPEIVGRSHSERTELEIPKEPEPPPPPPATEWVKLGVYVVLIFIGIYVAWIMVGVIRSNLEAPKKAQVQPGPEPEQPKLPVKQSGPVAKNEVKKTQDDPGAQAAIDQADAEAKAMAALQQALQVRDRALESNNFAGARQALLRFRAAHRVGPASDLANRELRDTDKIIGDTLSRMLKDAESAVEQKEYRKAVTVCTRLTSGAVLGDYAQQANALLQRIDREAEGAFRKANQEGDRALNAGKLPEAMTSLSAGLDAVGGTQWAEKLTARQLQLVYANKLLKNCESARIKRAMDGKPTEVRVLDPADRKIAAILLEIQGLTVRAEDKGASFPYPMSRMHPDDIYQLVELLGQGQDHLGMANLLGLLGHKDLAQKEIDRALKDPEQAAQAARMASSLAGVSNLHSYDFSKWQHQSDWEAQSGAWATKDDRYVLESPEGGDTVLRREAIGGAFSARNARIGCDFALDPAKAAEGWFVAVEFGTEQRNVTAIFSASGLQLQANANEMKSEKGDWKPDGSEPTRVELAFDSYDEVRLSLNGKPAATLKAAGVSGLTGTVAFHIRETLAEFDNVTLRNVEK